jgi:hypothetical protein
VSSVGQELNASCTGHPGDAHDPVPSDPLVTPPKVPAADASHLFTVPASLHDRPPRTVSPPAVPAPSTPFSSGTAVFAPAVLYSQFSDTYKPVPVPADCEYPDAAYLADAVTRLLAAVVPAAAGAVPSTARFPDTADCQVVPIASVPEVAVVGVSVKQPLVVDGSPITSTAYDLNVVAESASHCAGVAWSTVQPVARSAVVSGAVDSPFCSSTSALPGGVAALAVGAAATPPTATAVAPATATATAAGGSAIPPAVKTSPRPAARTFRTARAARRNACRLPAKLKRATATSTRTGELGPIIRL